MREQTTKVVTDRERVNILISQPKPVVGTPKDRLKVVLLSTQNKYLNF